MRTRRASSRELANDRGAATNGHFRSDIPEKGVHRMGTNSHPDRNFLTGEPKHQEPDGFLFALRKAKLIGHLRDMEASG